MLEFEEPTLNPGIQSPVRRYWAGFFDMPAHHSTSFFCRKMPLCVPSWLSIPTLCFGTRLVRITPLSAGLLLPPSALKNRPLITGRPELTAGNDDSFQRGRRGIVGQSRVLDAL